MTTTTAAAPIASEVRTPWTEFWRKFRKQRVAVIAGLFIVLLVALALVAPWIVPYDAENYFDYDSLNALPSAQHWFGVDPLGRDILSRVLMGSRISLMAGFVGAIGATRLFNAAAAILLASIDGILRLATATPGSWFSAQYRVEWVGPAALTLLMASCLAGYGTGWRRSFGSFWPPFAIVALTLLLGVRFG